VNASERRLLHAWRGLSEDKRAGLLDYAEFLGQRAVLAQESAVKVQEPLDIPRPEVESVIKAVRRLKVTYPSLDAEHSLLNEVSAQMTRHIIHGDTALQVIDRLEIIFRQKYDSHQLSNPLSL